MNTDPSPVNPPANPPSNPPRRSQSKGRGLILLLSLIALLAAVWYFTQDRLCTNVTGTITRQGKPLLWEQEGGHLLVIFVPEDRRPNENPIRAESDRATGKYQIPELRAGTYRVAIHMFDDRHMDALNNKFDPGNSPLRVTVSDSDQVIDVDIP